MEPLGREREVPVTLEVEKGCSIEALLSNCKLGCLLVDAALIDC